MPKETLFLYSSTVSLENKRKIFTFAESIGAETPTELTPHTMIPSTVDAVVASGGDGTVRSVFAKLPSETELYIHPVGTFNGTAESLIQTNTIVHSADFKKGDYPEPPIFSPGYINNVLFLHGTAWDKFGVGQAKVIESLRWMIPSVVRNNRSTRRLRVYIGSFYAAWKYRHALSDEYVVSLALLSSNLGPFPVYAKQQVHDDTIVIARVRGGSGALGRLGEVFFQLTQRRPVSPGLIEFDQKKTHTIHLESPMDTVTVDGEVEVLPSSAKELHIERRREAGVRTGVLLIDK